MHACRQIKHRVTAFELSTIHTVINFFAWTYRVYCAIRCWCSSTRTWERSWSMCNAQYVYGSNLNCIRTTICIMQVYRRVTPTSLHTKINVMTMVRVRIYIFKATKGENKRNLGPADVLFHLKKDENNCTCEPLSSDNHCIQVLGQTRNYIL